MNEITLVAVLGVAMGALIVWLVNRYAPAIEKALRRPSGVRAHVDASAAGLDEAGESAHFLLRTDPSDFEAGLPNWESYAYAFDRAPHSLGAPPSEVCREWRGWAHSMGGVDAGWTKVQVVIEGQSDSEVLIDGLEVDIWKRTTALKGTHVLCPTGGASASPREIVLDLDAKPPAYEYLEAGGEPSAHFLFRLNKGEVETFRIFAHASACYCEWTARLRVVIEGSRRDIEINDDGDAFRTTGTSHAVQVVWDGTDWVPHDARL